MHAELSGHSAEIDLRSDTVTFPTPEMIEAMTHARLGDDCYGEDPTVVELEALAAAKVGKEAALFLPSGTMGNLVALMTHTRPGDEVVLDSHSHIYEYEVGGLSAVAGLVPRLYESEAGLITPEGLESVLRTPYILFPPTRLLCLENTHNFAGGTVMHPEQMAQVATLARTQHLAVHLDGARIFNAAVALGLDARTFTEPVDSVMFCLSKGLSAPVGSMLAGSLAFIERARKNRRMLGGGMRQAGMLAAAGIVALKTMVGRLSLDHENARLLALGLAEIDGIGVDLETVQTNMVNVNVRGLGLDTDGFIQALRPYGIQVNPRRPHRVRMVTHRHITQDQIARTLEVVGEIADRANGHDSIR